MKPFIVVTSKLPLKAILRLKPKFKVKELHTKIPLKEEDLINILKDCDGAITLLSDPITKRVLENSKMKIIANYAVGYNNIDVEYATKKGIVITNTPDVLTDATADLTLALLLSVARRIIEGDLFTRKGKFKGWQPSLFLGFDLKGKSIGIIGMGRIGKAVARRCIPFGLKIYYSQRQRLLKSEEDALNAKYLPLDELIKSCDIITLHCPYTNETHKLLNRDRIFSMKKGSILLNTSRGLVVDEDALSDALISGHLYGAGLDVYEKEPKINEKLLKLKNVVLLPHIGSAGKETREEMAELAVTSIISFFEGKVPANIIPEQRELLLKS